MYTYTHTPVTACIYIYIEREREWFPPLRCIRNAKLVSLSRTRPRRRSALASPCCLRRVRKLTLHAYASGWPWCIKSLFRSIHPCPTRCQCMPISHGMGGCNAQWCTVTRYRRNLIRRTVRPISLLALSLPTLLESNLPGNRLWAWECHPWKLRLCLSQTLENEQC